MAYAFWLRQWLQLVPISTDGFWPAAVIRHFSSGDRNRCKAVPLAPDQRTQNNATVLSPSTVRASDPSR